MSEIPYCDKIWEPIGGCTHCSPGCQNCWAEQLTATRFKGKPRYDGLTKNGRWTGKIKLFEDRLEQPLHYRDPKRIFVCSQADLFHPKVPFGFIAEVYKTAAFTERHTYLLLTKRINRALEFFKWLENKYTYDGGALMFKGTTTKWQYRPWPIPNVQLFVSISTQAEADEKIPILLQIPAAVRGVSLEPLLEDIDFGRVCNIKGPGLYRFACNCNVPGVDFVGDRFPERRGPGGPENRNDPGWDTCCKKCGCSDYRMNIDQVIIGCESIRGKPGRPCKLEWVRSIVQQCQSAGVAVYVKQLILDGKLVRDAKQFPDGLHLFRQLVK